MTRENSQKWNFQFSPFINSCYSYLVLSLLLIGRLLAATFLMVTHFKKRITYPDHRAIINLVRLCILGGDKDLRILYIWLAQPLYS